VIRSLSIAAPAAAVVSVVLGPVLALLAPLVELEDGTAAATGVDSSAVIRALWSSVVTVVLALLVVPVVVLSVLPPLVELPPRLVSVAQVVGESLYFPMGHMEQMTSVPSKLVDVAVLHLRVADPADMW
jgi:hypothetical protein